jgi:L-alanine-DL-glutamate epimerase-like enolase superfamily enzyme
MTEMPYLFLRAHVEFGFQRASGIAADCLPVKWFTKIPTRSIADEIEEMLLVIEHAAQIAEGQTGASVFELWQKIYAAQDAWRNERNLPPLLAHFGTSLVERALIEAAGRHAQLPFAAMLRENRLGIRLGEIHPALRGSTPRDWLPAQPLASVIARHTVGLADPLRDAEIRPEDRVDDGLPQSLEECISAYGLKHFKLKASGNFQKDVPRLREIAMVLRERCGESFAVTLDGNEAFDDPMNFRLWWDALRLDPEVARMFERLLLVEQPFHRDFALSNEVGALIAGWSDGPPMIIDESDGELGSLPRALELGYRGASHKNCKGVFKGIANRCLLAQRAQLDPRRKWIMSGEDLCGVGPVAVLQDLAVQAALGNASVERNGHHYVAGLSGFTEEFQEAMLFAHPDLYQPSSAGWPTLRIRGGELALSSINRAPLGVGTELPVDHLPTVAEWRAGRTA